MAEKWKKRSGLGRGLGALLDDTEEKETLSGAGATIRGAINEIPLDQIEVNPFQPRTDFNEEALNELAESIKVQGIIQPITVRALSETEFQLISGERRFQASKRAGLEKIPAYIRTADDQQMLEMALIENIQRENLNAIEIALSYQRLLSECDLKQEQLGDRVGKNRTTVNNYLRLLKLPPDIQIALRDGKISMGHARAIINIENVDAQLDIFKKIIAQELSVRKVEELVRAIGKPKTETLKPEPQVNPEIQAIENRLTSHFGTRISIKSDTKNKGEIKIPFVSSDELNRILDILDL
ncbi:ParB/RepB/Spo0J family partition protein [Marinoscillum sp. MHG1-6]|uniref:ParB/RepB/Spo0J family partition protein n=1 Tax=Marinoscillum sp. MHG1-6 TaxID=2959627 RepID=UPI0021582FB2|nr:ParB/RepB/Spo0J family partition protein [Marinoscillum sp. MHG1-6]